MALRFRYRLPLAPGLQASTAREVAIPWISLKEEHTAAARLDLSLAPEIVLAEVGPGWVRGSDSRIEPASDGSLLHFVEEAPAGAARPFTFKALALEPVPLPSCVVPRLLIKTVRAADDTIRTAASYWVESHGPDFPFALPAGARWIGARIGGRIASQVGHDPGSSEYRLRFPGDVGARPVLVELEYQESGESARASWRAPRLLEGGVVLQTLWEMRLPWSLAIVGIPRGWSDENQWYWSGYMWKQRPWRNIASLNEWLQGASPPALGLVGFDAANPDDADRYVFSRSGEPGPIGLWFVRRSWLVAICSGATLVLGFVAIFSRIQFRIVWMLCAVAGLLAAVQLQPGVTFLALQSSVIGALFLLLGLLIERMIERRQMAVAADRSRQQPKRPHRRRFIVESISRRRVR